MQNFSDFTGIIVEHSHSYCDLMEESVEFFMSVSRYRAVGEN